MQFVGPERPEVSADNPNDIITAEGVADSVSSILTKACYDCHSMETKYPVYANVAPVSWFLYGHINQAREELNFSNWTQYDKSKKIKLLKDIREVMEKEEMPLTSYVLLHPEGKLSEIEVKSLIAWSDKTAKAVFSNK